MLTAERVPDRRATASEAGTDSHYHYHVNTGFSGDLTSPAGGVTPEEDGPLDIVDALIAGMVVLFIALVLALGY